MFPNIEYSLIEKYCEQHTTGVGEILEALERETHLKTTAPQMLSGTMQGRLLMLISQLLKPTNILEIGTFTGYSAICLAQGLQKENGVLHTIDTDVEKEWLIRKYIQKSNLEDKIQLHFGDAKEIIPTLGKIWDLVFIDADKENYSLYYDMVIDNVRSGGLIIADNVLWKGFVTQIPHNKVTALLHDFNEKTQSDHRVENILFPIRDGLMIIRKL